MVNRSSARRRGRCSTRAHTAHTALATAHLRTLLTVVFAPCVKQVLEETSVGVASAEIVASQPWPCGRGASCEIMLAVAARADPTAEAVDVGTDGVSGGG